ncbi:hypothetical protein ACRAWF_40905 [Streptomyces sp. L7]
MIYKLRLEGGTIWITRFQRFLDLDTEPFKVDFFSPKHFASS